MMLTHWKTGDQYPTCYWSTIETNVAVCCACMPNLRLLLVKLFPKIGGTSGKHSRNNAPISLSLYQRQAENYANGSTLSKKTVYSHTFKAEYGSKSPDDCLSVSELVSSDPRLGTGISDEGRGSPSNHISEYP